MTYRVEFGGRAGLHFHTLPARAKDALVECAAEIADEPWDATVRPPGHDPRFRERLFDSGHGIVGFYVDDKAEVVRIFDIVWVDTDM